MNTERIINEIFETRKVQDASGSEYPLDSNVEMEEGEFLMQLIEKYKPKRTIEVGCAFGLSSLFICSALEKIGGNKHHTIIDAFQSGYFHNIGVTNLKKANVDFYELIEGLSEIELPRLLSEGKRYDFCFIDGNHTFDHTLLDFFYLNRMVNVGGLIVFDDIGFPAVTKALRYILNYPGYKYVGNVQGNFSAKREMFNSLFKKPLGLLANLFPRKIKHEIFSSSIIASDKKLHLNTSMIAIQKVKEDDRQWFWYEDF